MTTSVSTRSPQTQNPTRQQLEELDALLQRMLELPVHKLDDTEPSSAIRHPPSAINTPFVESGQRTADSGQRTADSGQRAASPPVSYMVVETASPRPVPAPTEPESRPASLTPRLVPVTPVPPQDKTSETPVPPPDKAGETPIPLEQTSGTPVSPQAPDRDEGEMWVPLRSTWQPSAQTWQPLADSWHQAQGGLPIPEVMPSPIPTPPLELLPPPLTQTQQVGPEARPDTSEQTLSLTETESITATPASVPTTAGPRLSLSAEDAPITGPILLLPLLWFNQGFDACLTPLGTPGRWLCGPRGRQMLGFLGLTCLAASVAIAFSTGMGWTW